MSRNAQDLAGICTSCHEHTTVHEACCGAPVLVEGHTYDPDDYCQWCGEEMHEDDDEDMCDGYAEQMRQEKEDRACERFDRERDERKDREAEKHTEMEGKT